MTTVDINIKNDFYIMFKTGIYSYIFITLIYILQMSWYKAKYQNMFNHIYIQAIRCNKDIKCDIQMHAAINVKFVNTIKLSFQ